jgi:septal ring-binding cell division protein DamX
MSTQDTHATDTLDPLMDATFNEPSMQERVELIIHLLRHSDRVFTIMSDDANVLSGFSHKLTHHDTQGLHYAEVYPSAGMDAEDIVMHLARGWGVDVDFGETAMNALFQRLPTLLTDPRRAVAIIHFADTLPPMILDGLIGFMQRLDQLLDGRVRLILTGSALLTQRIAPMQTLAEAGQVYALHLQPIAPSPATHGFVSAAAAEVLDPNEPAPSVERKSANNAGNTNNARGLLLGGLGVSLILAVVVAMLLRPDAPEAPKDTTVSIPLTPPEAPSVAPSSPPASEAETPSEPVPASVEAVAQTSVPTSTAEAVATPPTSTMPPPAVQTPLPQNAHSGTQPSVYAPVPLKAAEPAAPVTDAVAAASTIAPSPKPTAPQAKAETKAKPLAQTGERFSTSNSSQYVVQIITLGSAKAVSAFIKTHHLEDCHSFRQQRDGKELFSLTCGLYPNREAALAAQNQLPSSVSVAKPYPRQIADIRKVMLP